jgi:hypothetical protein
MEAISDIHNWIREIYKDPITKMLSENSNLTKTQLETFLISILTDQVTENRIKIREKVNLRIKGKISRGAFNRTLKQAQKNIISSIYTLLLLGYLGIFDSPALLQYVEASNKLQNYLETYRDEWLRNEDIKEKDIKFLNVLKKEMERIVSEFATPKKLTNRL